jgi:lauroyl/myristoyl acyltransferase
MNWKKTVKRKIRQPFETLGFILIRLLIPLTPRFLIPLQSRLLARILLRCCTSQRKTALDNLNAVYKESRTSLEKERILIQSTATFIQTYIDLIWFTFRSSSRIKKFIDTSRFENETAHNLPPTIFVTAHLGNWELLGHLIQHLQLPFTTVAAPIKNPTVDRMLNRIRQKSGQQIISAHGAFRKITAAIKQGRHTALLLDQTLSPSKGGIPIHFIHATAHMAPSAALLAYRTQTPIRFSYCIPQPNGHYKVILSKPLTPPPYQTAQHKPIIHNLTQTITDQLTHTILQHPHNWIWSYPYWKNHTPQPPAQTIH